MRPPRDSEQGFTLIEMLISLMIFGMITAAGVTLLTLTVRTQVQGPKVRVEITDTGAGVPVAEREKIFEPFFSTKSQGTGLGLSLSRQIIDAHGGALTIEGPEGQGATFSITLPSA